MTRDSAFRYPELQHDADSIRILTLEPGRFLDQLVCRLTACTFASKPRYVALSYTWETPYPDNEWLLPDTLGDGVSTNITVNGVPYQIQRNLYMALLYLRSSEHPFNIWVDAVCIDQSNIQERNAQVSLMSFIYKRAQKVVTWLGTRALPEMGGDLFRAMGMDWALGETRHLAASLSSSSDQHQYRDRKDSNNNAWSRKPDSDTMARIAESRYWRRMWVVQELCLPRVLLFVYESRVWSYEDLCQSKVLQARVKERGSLPGGSNTFHHRTDQDDARFEAMSLLLRAREARFKLVTLEDLVDRFGNQECTQIRDKVYGLLSLAHDIRPWSAARGGVTNGLENHVVSKSSGGRERVPFEVNYAKPLFEIWLDMIKLVLERGERYSEDDDSRAVRRSIVRTAAVIQKAFGRKFEEEMDGITTSKQVHHHPCSIRAEGFSSGTILHLRPSYGAVMGSHTARQDWKDAFEAHYSKPSDLELLRHVNEEFMAQVESYGPSDLRRIQQMSYNERILAWPASQAPKPDLNGTAQKPQQEEGEPQDGSREQLADPIFCLGTGHLIALVPPTAKVGDVLVQFWGCSAALVMRQIKTTDDGAPSPVYALVGRADVAGCTMSELLEGGGPGTASSNDVQPSELSALNVDLDIRTLQIISCRVHVQDVSLDSPSV